MNERAEQFALIQWLDLNKIAYFAVPNATQMIKYLSTHQKARFFQERKKEGVKKGVPDLFVMLPGKILAIEMKRSKGGRATNEQKEWIAYLNGLPYCEAKICAGSLDAIEFVKRSIEDKIMPGTQKPPPPPPKKKKRKSK